MRRAWTFSLDSQAPTLALHVLPFILADGITKELHLQPISHQGTKSLSFWLMAVTGTTYKRAQATGGLDSLARQHREG